MLSSRHRGRPAVRANACGTLRRMEVQTWGSVFIRGIHLHDAGGGVGDAEYSSLHGPAGTVVHSVRPEPAQAPR